MALCIKLQHPLALAWAQKLCGSSFTAWVSMGEQLLLVAQCLCLYGVQLLLPISLVFVTVISISISVTCEHFWNCTEKRNARYAAYWKSLDAVCARYRTHSECEVKVLARQASIITAVIANWNIYTQKKYSTATRSQARTHFAHADTTVADLTRWWTRMSLSDYETAVKAYHSLNSTYQSL